MFKVWFIDRTAVSTVTVLTGHMDWNCIFWRSCSLLFQNCLLCLWRSGFPPLFLFSIVGRYSVSTSRNNYSPTHNEFWCVSKANRVKFPSAARTDAELFLKNLLGQSVWVQTRMSKPWLDFCQLYVPLLSEFTFLNQNGLTVSSLPFPLLLRFPSLTFLFSLLFFFSPPHRCKKLEEN